MSLWITSFHHGIYSRHLHVVYFSSLAPDKWRTPHLSAPHPPALSNIGPTEARGSKCLLTPVVIVCFLTLLRKIISLGLTELHKPTTGGSRGPKATFVFCDTSSLKTFWFSIITTSVVGVIKQCSPSDLLAAISDATQVRRGRRSNSESIPSITSVVCVIVCVIHLIPGSLKAVNY